MECIYFNLFVSFYNNNNNNFDRGRFLKTI